MKEDKDTKPSYGNQTMKKCLRIDLVSHPADRKFILWRMYLHIHTY